MVEGISFEYVRVNGIKIHCAFSGEGKPVIFLHGFPECWYSWRHQISALSGRFLAIAPDMRGYNLSDKPSGVSSYRISELTSDVVGLIKHFGSEKAHIIGHDWGGAVAWSFAMLYPKMTDKLAVLNCPHPIAFIENLRKNPRQLRRSLYMFFFQIPKIPEALFRANDYYLIRRVFTDWAINKSAFTEEDIRFLAQAAARPGALTGGINYYRAMFRDKSNIQLLLASKRGEFPVVNSPTLIIWAERDKALGKELTYGMEKYVRGDLRTRYIPNCSHWVQQEQPVLVNEMLLDFLE